MTGEIIILLALIACTAWRPPFVWPPPALRGTALIGGHAAWTETGKLRGKTFPFSLLSSPPASWEIYNLGINARVAGSGDRVEDASSGGGGWKMGGGGGVLVGCVYC